MKAKEFITEYKVINQLLASRKLTAAMKMYNKIKREVETPMMAVTQAVNSYGISPRMLRDFLQDRGLFESERIDEMYIAFELDKKSRRQLAQTFEPKYPEFIGHHITYKFGVPKDSPIPSMPKSIEVIGYVDDGDGLEALVVAINGSKARPDGKIYHITWSLDREKGKKPVHSNNLIAAQGFERIAPIPIQVKPKLLG